jgi:hypothetical protein
MLDPYDSLWSAVNRDAFNAEERVRHGYRDKMFLGRYGRQSIDTWDDMTVAERQNYIAALSELLKEENEATKSNPARSHEEHR